MRLSPLLLAALFGCASLETGADWDRSLDFHAFDTFAFAEVVPDGGRPAPSGSEHPGSGLPVAAALREVLGEKGLVETTRLEASLWVSFHVLFADRVELASGSELDAYGRPHAYRRREAGTPGSLVVDLVDASTGAVVWHGWGYQAVAAGGVGDGALADAVRSILARFPPPAPGP